VSRRSDKAPHLDYALTRARSPGKEAGTEAAKLATQEIDRLGDTFAACSQTAKVPGSFATFDAIGRKLKARGAVMRRLHSRVEIDKAVRIRLLLPQPLSPQHHVTRVARRLRAGVDLIWFTDRHRKMIVRLF
jgi:hypothetical protein